MAPVTKQQIGSRLARLKGEVVKIEIHKSRFLLKIFSFTPYVATPKD